MEKLKVGDMVYYVEPDTDSEVEGYVYKVLDNNIYEVKIREGRKFGFFGSDRLTKIDPPNWESLEENLEANNIDTKTSTKTEEILKDVHKKLKKEDLLLNRAGMVVNIV